MAVASRTSQNERLTGSKRRTAVISVGGNALIRPGESGSGLQQLQNAVGASRHIASMAEDGWQLAIVHGNGPQVGLMLRRSELGAEEVPELSLEGCVAACQGELGYILQQSITNALNDAGSSRRVASIVTQVEVAAADPAFQAPTKPIGAFYSRARAYELQREHGWSIVEDAGRGWRRVVPSPKPVAVVETSVIRELVYAGTVTICAGGGGIPVLRREDGSLEGVAAVVDKDLASALLARDLEASLLIILTEVEAISIYFGTSRQRALSVLSAADAEKYLNQGQFPAGSMGPKIESALSFLRNGGREVLVTNITAIDAALERQSGTWISG